MRLRGRTRRGPFEQSLEVEWPDATPDRSPLWLALPQMWARARVEHLLGESRHDSSKASPLRDEVLSLGLTYRLLTPYTSFVAIEERRDAHSSRDKAERVQVPIHLPEGTLREAFEPPQPVYASMMMHRLSAAPGAPPAAPQARKATGMLGGIGAALREGIGMLGSTRGGEAAPPPAADAAYAAAPMPAPASTPQQAAPAQSDEALAQAALRSLARTQSVNGSWGDDVAATALSLAAFLSSGHSDSAGSFRPQLTRAVQWLAARATQPGTPAVATWALTRLADTTKSAAHAAMRDGALAALAPTDAIDRGFAALAQHQQPDLSALPPNGLATTAGVLATLLRALDDQGAATATAQQLAGLQQRGGSTSGTIAPQGASAATVVAATALGALVWSTQS